MFRLSSVLLLCISACTATKKPCNSYHSSVFEDVAVECPGMNVTQVPWWLLHPGLRMLKLTGTAITTLDNDTFRGADFQHLKNLYVTGGLLTSVWAHAFCHLPALTTLYLDHNRLEMLDASSFSCNRFLRTVSLLGNSNLRLLPPLVSSSVEHLYLDNCSLTSINVSTFESMPALKVLSLSGNPDLHCPSLISQFKLARPHVLVRCENPTLHPSSSAFPDDEQHTSAEPHNGSDAVIKNMEKDTTVNPASRIPMSVTEVPQGGVKTSTFDQPGWAAFFIFFICVILFYFIFRLLVSCAHCGKGEMGVDGIL